MLPSVLDSRAIVRFITDLLSPGMHRKRAFSIGQAVIGLMLAERLSSAFVGRSLAAQIGITPKSGIKQVDRLLGNQRFDVASAFGVTVPWLIGGRREIVVSLDWTEYGLHGHSRISLNLVTNHGRATPLVWKTVLTERLGGRQTGFEDEALNVLASVLPAGVRVTLLADRGFSDIRLYEYLRDELRWDFVIRFRAGMRVENAAGHCKTAGDWVPRNGRVLTLPDARVTKQRFGVNVVCVKRRSMKDSWCLATSLRCSGDRVVKLYGKRFTCEETFRDEKDPRLGWGGRQTKALTTERRDRFLFIAMLATILLTTLGAAGEQLRLDRTLRANTSSRRTHSLIRQGREYLAGRIGRHLDALRAAFLALLEGHPSQTSLYGLI